MVIITVLDFDLDYILLTDIYFFVDLVLIFLS